MSALLSLTGNRTFWAHITAFVRKHRWLKNKFLPGKPHNQTVEMSKALDPATHTIKSQRSKHDVHLDVLIGLYKKNFDYLWAHVPNSDETNAVINKYCDFESENMDELSVFISTPDLYEGLIQAYIQRGVGEKAVNQLEKLVHSKLEAIVARQIQAQFQTSGKQALQDAINSASSITQTLSSEVADGQRKLVALAVAGENSRTGGSFVTQFSDGSIDGFLEKLLPGNVFNIEAQRQVSRNSESLSLFSNIEVHPLPDEKQDRGVIAMHLDLLYLSSYAGLALPRLLGFGEEKNPIKSQKREKSLKSLGSVKHKRQSEVEHFAKALRTETSRQ
ncbi:hypothetical protein CTI12_AA308880 [Artemisia annua]|uniref:Toc75-like POTRA domain-containing protein n=1 Tax=Artemisia annua TaxID=35608 RepID=A0A2U1N489_ARTAN|nr:hypothetical protein CTI12_AA308880 [Artemisia annua]